VVEVFFYRLFLKQSVETVTSATLLLMMSLFILEPVHHLGHVTLKRDFARGLMPLETTLIGLLDKELLAQRAPDPQLITQQAPPKVCSSLFPY
jgi:hypothetical protein